jgi:alkanesulfonate monooxygenase SsuD/methylene tetrahydromethanopterin reductase-like flavin-dependent oxidoreductase (luciferase family)
MAYALAVTDNIHIGSGIINITPPVCPPARVAEKVAMLDMLAPGRFEWGTGRGSSSEEVFGFGIESMDITREMYDEALPEILKMMGPEPYGPYEGRFFSMPRRQVLPKPVTLPHPPIWVAAGSPGTFEKAGKLGIGVLCFSFAGVEALKPLIDVYKEAIKDADPVGGYINDNVMVTTAMTVSEDGERAREVFANAQADYHTSLVAKYLDSFPQTAGISKVPTLKDPIPRELVDQLIADRRVAVGTPEEAIATLETYQAIGADQVAFGIMADDTPLDAAIESVETFGKHIVPVFDPDPVHSTTRQRIAQLGS